MNAQECIKNMGARGVSAGPFTLRKAFDRELRDNFRKDGKEWSQHLLCSDSTGEVHVYLVDKDDVKAHIGGVVTFKGANISPRGNVNVGHKAEIVFENAIQRGAEVVVETENSDAEEAGESVAPLEDFARLYKACLEKAEMVTSMRFLPLGELADGTDPAPYLAQNALVKDIATTFFIQMVRR